VDQVLSQQEIDQLLSAMSSGELDEEIIEEESEKTKVKKYDFRRPTKLSKEYINTLYMIFEDFSKMSSSVLSTQLRTNVGFHLAAIEQVSYDEFIHSIPKFTLLGIFHSQPLNGVQLVEMNPQLCMLLVEILCGGLDSLQAQETFDQEKVIPPKKSFTEIEVAVLEEVVQQLLFVFEHVWQDTCELTTGLEGMDTNPQLLQNMSPNEPVVMVTFTIKVLKMETFINLCIPYVFFEGILDKLSFRNWFDSNQQGSAADTQELQKNLNAVDLELKVTLGDAQMNLADFLHLAPGDVVKLDRKITDPLDTFIEGEKFYKVRPGKYKDQLAVELLDKMEGEQEE